VFAPTGFMGYRLGPLVTCTLDGPGVKGARLFVAFFNLFTRLSGPQDLGSST